MDYGIDYSMLPEHMRESTKLYIEKGIMPGSFLEAVMSNNLVEAFERADPINRSAMYQWAKFLYNEAPAGCWGFNQRVYQWVQKGGLDGIRGKA